MRFVLVVLLLVLFALAAPTGAQFSQFGWTLDDSQGGVGFLSDTGMGVHGNQSLFPGAIVKYTTLSHVAGRVSAHAHVMPEDGVCSGGGSAALTIVGATNSTYANCNFDGTVTFDAKENQVFGFGLQTFNTSWPYSVNLNQFTFTPYWTILGGALAGGSGTPVLTGLGIVQPSQTISLMLTGAAPGAAAALVLGLGLANAPFKGGVLVPTPDVIVSGLLTSGAGGFLLSGALPGSLPPGFALYAQVWIVDAGGPVGFAATNGIRGTVLP